MRFLSALIKSVFILFISFSFFVLAPDTLAAPFPFMTLEDNNAALTDCIDPANPSISQPCQEMMQTRTSFYSMSSMIGCTYISPLNNNEPITSPSNKEALNKTVENCQTTALGYTSNVIASLYSNQPASLAWYVQDTLATAGLAKPVYAQGIGFSGLIPILPLWKTFRDISYIVLVFIMVIIGFMIIFRMKLDPKTVISVQAALPKIIITLLLITFSYAIAGFLIDLMYVSMGVIIYVLGSAFNSAGGAVQWVGVGTDVGDIAKYQQTFLTADAGDLFNSVFAFGLFPAAMQQFFGGSLANIGVGAGFLGIGGGIATVVLGSVGFWPILAGVGVAGGLVLFLVLLGLLFTFIRLLFLLINAYFQILIGVIFAPFFIMQEAIPGRSAFSQWILNLIANLSVFPATAAIIYLSWMITSISWSGTLWSPPFIGFPGTTGASGTQFGNPFAVIFGFSIIFLSPNLVASIKKVFHPKPSLPITAGSVFSPVSTAVGGTMSTVQQFYYPMQIAREAGPLAEKAKHLFGGGK